MTAELRGRFDDPPRAFSPVPLWWWSGDPLDPERLRWQLERFAEGGIFNLVVMNLAPTSPMFGSDADDPPFFSKEWWVIFRGVCEDAGRLGVSIWFYDQIGFSGANLQAGIVKERPEFAGQWLERTATEMSEPGELACPAGGEPVSAAAIPIDDEGAPAGAPVPLPVQDGKVVWDGAGPHRVMLFYSVERGFDYHSPDACRALIDRVHGAYEAHVGDLFGTTIVGSFQDELPSMPTWSRNFAERFVKHHGYDPGPHLAALWEEYDGAGRVRRDFHATRAAVSEETFFKPLFDWHEERGLVCGFDQQDPVRAGFPVESVDRYADYQRTHRWYAAPGSDHHGDAKIHSSLAHLYDRPRTWIEAFHSSGWGGTLEETFDWLLPWLRAGANLYDPHAVYYSTRGGWWEWAPPSTDWRQPYWEHYHRFSRTVSRLCSVLTLGHHVCDVGLLFPTTTVQAGLRLDGAEPYAKTAHETYLKLAGTMPWYEVEPGALDHANRDFDVLDEDSIQRSETEDGHLRVGDERYATVVLPDCAVLEAATASRLVDFVERGGLLVAVGGIPRSAVGTGGGDESIGTLASLFDEGRARRLDSPEDLTGLLAGVPGPVEAPVPTLMRRVGDATVLFVPAAFPRATELRMHGGRGTEGGWLDIEYEFDPSTYHRHVDIRVEGVRGNPALWEPYSGEKRPLGFSADDSGMEVRVPFDDGPGVLVVWEESGVGGDTEGDADAARRAVVRSEDVLDEVWTVELEPTLDNRWGDFARPVDGASVPVERWEVLHRAEGTGETAGWARPDLDDSGWSAAHATFGPRGLWAGPAAPNALPSPARDAERVGESFVGDGSGADGGWRTASYSLSRGIYKDRIHRGTLGPTGHVPEEFLDFGRVVRGEAVQFRTTVSLSEPLGAHFALGAAARKRVWINGAEVVPGRDDGYLLTVPVALDGGSNVVEFRLEAEEDVELRAHFAFVREPEGYVRPELIRAGDGVIKDTVVSYGKTVSVPFAPEKAVVQVGCDAPCRVYVNGVQVGRQGGFDPYFELHQARIQPYDVTAQAREGENEVAVEVSDLGVPHAVSVDGLFEAGGGSVPIVSDGTWEATRDGEPVRLGLRREPFGSIFPWGDPAQAHLRRRPHPLPGSGWLEDRDPDGTVIGLVPDARAGRSRTQWLRFPVPPGATLMRLAVHGSATVYLDGEEVTPERDAEGLEAELPRAGEPERVCALRVEPEPGHEAGAILDGPIRFATGEGSMRLGDWEDRGLSGYSGGVRYKRGLEWTGAGGEDARVVLDLGRVRGTAEVVVNGVSAGVRIWSPYAFDLTGHLSPGENDLEVRVFNTAGPYLDAVSPTRFVFDGQRVSGLMGPVKVLEVEG